MISYSSAISTVTEQRGGGKEMDEKRLEELAIPLMDYLKENCHPYTSILIGEGRVAVLETVLSIPKGIDAQ